MRTIRHASTLLGVLGLAAPGDRTTNFDEAGAEAVVDGTIVMA